MKDSSKPISELNSTEVEESMELESKSFRFDMSILRDVFTVPSNWIRNGTDYHLQLVFLQGLPGSMPWSVYSIYLHSILCSEKHLSIDTVMLNW